jgi:hypothetical protein
MKKTDLLARIVALEQLVSVLSSDVRRLQARPVVPEVTWTGGTLPQAASMVELREIRS